MLNKLCKKLASRLDLDFETIMDFYIKAKKWFSEDKIYNIKNVKEYIIFQNRVNRVAKSLDTTDENKELFIKMLVYTFGKEN